MEPSSGPPPVNRVGVTPDVTAPDGLAVHLLGGTTRGSHARFELPAGNVGRAIRHRSVDEVWYFLSGRGSMWRELDGHESIDVVEPGVAVSLPVGTSFQLMAEATAALAAVAVTMPPWPGDDEAIVVEGPWAPTVG